jgi:hypothetical protein
MDFVKLGRSAARKQLQLAGGVMVNLVRQVNPLSSVLALIERDIQYQVENGLSVERRTFVSMLVEDVGDLKRGDEIVSGASTFKVQEPVSCDEFVIQVFVRG